MSSQQLFALLIALGSTASAAGARQVWAQVEERKLVGNDTNDGDWLGSSLAIDGNTALVGAPHADVNERGAAYVFVRANGSWSMQAKLVATGTTTDFDHFGASIALDGDTALVGAPEWSSANAGRVFVFQRSGTTWSPAQTFGPAFPNEQFGTAVAIRDDHFAASAPLRGIFREGALAIYTRSAGTWSLATWIPSEYQDDDNRMGAQIALSKTAPTTYTLIASTDLDGAEIYQGSGASWNFTTAVNGNSQSLYTLGVAATDTTLAVGQPFLHFGSSFDAGRVHVYSINGSTLTLQATLNASDYDSGDRFGWSVALDGEKLVVGAPYAGDMFGPDNGAAYLFERTGAVWAERAVLAPSDPGPSDRFGTAVAISSNDVLVGSPFDNNGAGLAAGAAYALRVGFPSVSYCTAGISSANCTARMSSSGFPSASLATPFSIQASNLDGQRLGLVFYGVSGSQALPWGTASWLCVADPLQRSRAQLSNGTAGVCDGALALDWNAFQSQHPSALGQPFGAGDEVFSQTWYRDPASVKTTQLSDALAFVVQP